MSATSILDSLMSPPNLLQPKLLPFTAQLASVNGSSALTFSHVNWSHTNPHPLAPPPHRRPLLLAYPQFLSAICSDYTSI